ncbi:MAG TPA: hypothetical protein PLC51_09585 [Candidatus Marinimicrobia bacterium]|jgi:hypothetical protein|nr:hypothetical protein [Candidatus Neomarinimicrobiota bacterium]NLA21788.1 hypothetical protein [Candidatus Neomarinimicrobiota bacterium]HPY04218.1 hypothetical protein [Spirochaetota bacterium]HQC63296.1 hypothetical protein [Candidatus Neomarinimicrobiota bacterium]HQQ86231.1 hypothetical protein [Candidatus Neomarinimicrobiota bacterium]
MIIAMSKTDFYNKRNVRIALNNYLAEFSHKSVFYSNDEINSLIISALRIGDGNILTLETNKRNPKRLINTDLIISWIQQRIVPNTMIIKTDDPDLLRLAIFSLAMPYKMFQGSTRATVTEKTRRSKKRDFEQIFSDTFIGKIGEIAFKKFLLNKFSRKIDLDWEISDQIADFKSDIPNSKKIVSIKSTDTLDSIWAEAPQNADIGIFVKVAIPKDFFMKILAHISSLKKFLRFVEERLEKDDSVSKLLNFVEETAYSEEMQIKACILGYYFTAPEFLKRKGEEIPFLGEVHEDKFMIEYNKLLSTDNDWKNFIEVAL